MIPAEKRISELKDRSKDVERQNEEEAAMIHQDDISLFFKLNLRDGIG